MTGSLVLLALTALVAGLARGFSGFGAALIFIPVAAALTSPGFAAPLLLVIDGIVALPLIPGAWRLGDRREVFVMAAGAAVAVPFGAWALSVLPAESLRWGITLLGFAMLGLILSGWRFRGEPRPALAVLVGAVSGIFSGIAQIGGPPVVAWFMGRDNAPARLRANIVLFFAIGSLLSATSYLWRGLLTAEVVRSALLVGPAYGLGLWLGARAFGVAPASLFRRICIALIATALILGLPVWG